MCQDCHRFFIIAYERNDRGESVETGYELDIRVLSSGMVKAQSGEWEPPSTVEDYHRRRSDNDSNEKSCW